MLMTAVNVTAEQNGLVVNFSPSTELAEIIQNVQTILATEQGTVPLDREFGLDWSFVDKPLQVAQALMSSQAVQQINKYEPRAKVVSIGFDENQLAAQDGKLIPRVVIGVNE